MNAVVFSPCASYEPAEVRAALEAALSQITDFHWLRPGMTIAVKVNLLTMARPDKAVTTHPALCCALCDILKARGAGQVIFGDSPGGVFTASYVNRVYAACGLTAVTAHGGVLNQDFSEAHVTYPAGKACREFDCTAWLRKADAVINLCKLKTHGMMTLTAGVKNMFGAIPGTKKPEYHFRFPNPGDFADMLVDVCAYFAPVLTICDAVTAMEGNGPASGTPRHVGLLAASQSPYALDEALARLIVLPAERVPTLAAARARGLLPENPTILGGAGPISDFLIPEAGHGLLFEGRGRGMARLRSAVMRRCLASRPELTRKNACVGCRECQRVCPAGAIVMKNKKPVIHRRKCIRCFCCQEFCPHGALEAKRPPVARLLQRGQSE